MSNEEKNKQLGTTKPSTVESKFTWSKHTVRQAWWKRDEVYSIGRLSGVELAGAKAGDSGMSGLSAEDKPRSNATKKRPNARPLLFMVWVLMRANSCKKARGSSRGHMRAKWTANKCRRD